MTRLRYLVEMTQKFSEGSEGKAGVGFEGFTDEYMEVWGQNEGLL